MNHQVSLLAVALSFFLFLAPRAGAQEEANYPNIIYILVDDMGYSDLGCYGGEIETPHIDRLAAEGMSFRQFYNNAKCEPTRTSIMSGLYHGRGANAVGGATLGEALKSGGYRTYAVGKWHLGTGSLIPVRQGFDNFYGFYGGWSNYFPAQIGSNMIKRDTLEPNNFVSAYPESYFSKSSTTVSNQVTFPEGYYMTDGFGDNAVAFIQDAARNHAEEPFFMYLAFNAPHTPLQAPTDLIEKYRGRYAKGWEALREEKWERQKELGIVDPQWQLPELRDDIPGWDELSEEEREAEDHRRAVYAAMMDSVDQNVGKVLAQLEASGLDENTLVIFTGDNGAQAFDNTSNRSESPSAEGSRWSMGPAWAAYSNTPFRYYKQSQHQGGICTPLVARWPGRIAPGTMTDEPGHVVDMMATFVDIADVDYDSLKKNDGTPVPPMDGRSLLPIFEGGSREGPDFVGFEFGGSEFAVIQGDWKLVNFSSGPWRLYNLKEDRTETNNLRWEYPEKVAELAALYDQWAIDTYGNTSRTYAERDTRNQLSQELRYSRVLGGGLFEAPGGSKVELHDIGSGNGASLNDHWEHYLTETSAAGIGRGEDSVTFAAKSFFGDGSVIAQVESPDNFTSGGTAGLMFRESTETDSAFLMIGVREGGDCIQLHRPASGGVPVFKQLGSDLTFPIFLKITREADQFTPAYSADGETWTSLAVVELDLAMETMAGLAAFSGSNETRGSVIFREWESLDVATYPLRSRAVDGLPEYLAYALGAGAGDNARGFLPRLRLSEEMGSRYPELSFSRRSEFPNENFVIRWLGDDLSLWEDHTNEWLTVSEIPNPDGISEEVLMRRDSEISGGESAYYCLEVTE
ncbi:MAG: arylsulfatase [Verrucomicrobiota bacterium JB023]|nr:arylsulfatase [Verrucomicrobiota bacterium JB023]